MNAEIIICTEQGYLEKMSKMLVWSVRSFGGRYKNLPIYSYQPRSGHDISAETRAFFDNYEVQVVDEILNQKYPDYGLANKPLACAHRENNSSAESLIFLDSDIFFLNEPVDLLNFDGCDVIVRPVDYKNVGASGPDDKKANYWHELYKMFGVTDPGRVKTTASGLEIYPYFNSGHIVTKRDNGLFTRWLENFESVMGKELMPEKGLFYVEQSVFAATVSQLRLNVKQPENSYNFPIYFFNRITGLQERIDQLGDTVSIHYHGEFKNIFGYNLIHDFLESSENGRQINHKLHEFELIKRESEISILKFRVRRRLRKIRRDLQSIFGLPDF